MSCLSLSTTHAYDILCLILCWCIDVAVAKKHRQVEIAKKRLLQAKESKQNAQLADEEAKQWKESLCGQFSCLVKEADSRRSQKLIYIVDTYGM